MHEGFMHVIKVEVSTFISTCRESPASVVNGGEPPLFLLAGGFQQVQRKEEFLLSSVLQQVAATLQMQEYLHLIPIAHNMKAGLHVVLASTCGRMLRPQVVRYSMNPRLWGRDSLKVKNNGDLFLGRFYVARNFISANF